MSGDLFEDGPPAAAGSGTFAPATPLADRMRPRSLDEVEGPEEVVGANGFLRRAIAEDRVPSLILWGPPGVGKTTLARLIASQTSSHFVSYSAVATGVKEMREVLEDARRSRASATPSGRFCFSTRSTGSIARSRTSSCHTSSRATSSSSARRPRTRRSS